MIFRPPFQTFMTLKRNTPLVKYRDKFFYFLQNYAYRNSDLFCIFIQMS